VKRAPAFVLCAAIALGGACGGASHDMDPRSAKLLDAQIAAARDAAAHGDYARAATLLHSVDDTVGALRAQRMVSDRRAADILAATGETQAALRRYVVTSTTTTTTTTTTMPRATPPTQSPDQSPDRKKGKNDNHAGDEGD
jgi:hypothetical protein